MNLHIHQMAKLILLSFLLVSLAGFPVAGRYRKTESTGSLPASARQSGKSLANLSAPIEAHSPEGAGPDAPELDAGRRAQVMEAYRSLPLSFEANQGQVDAQVKFLARGPGYHLYLTPAEAVLTMNRPHTEKAEADKTDRKKGPGSGENASPGRHRRSPETLRIKLLNGNAHPRLEGLDALPGRTHYFAGKDPSQWHTGVASYAKVRYKEVYAGIDLIYYGSQGQLEYDFALAPYADPEVIRLAFGGARRLRLDESGDLVLTTSDGEVRQRKPHIYQVADEGTREIAGAFVIHGGREVGFAVGSYDRSKPLVIDPVLSYSTYLGANLGATIDAIAIDGAGNAYVTGETTSTNFPVTAKAYRTSPSNGFNIFVSKLNPTGTALLFSSYFTAEGEVFDIAADQAGNAYITGHTSSPSFPITAGAFQGSSAGDLDAFVAKLNTNPSVCTPQAPNINCREALVYSTYLGGISGDSGNTIALDASGNAYVAGQTHSSNFPTTAGAFQTMLKGGNDGFVTKLNPTGQALLYSTYLGGGPMITSGLDTIYGIAVNSTGNAYVTGSTNSHTFPTTAGVIQPSCRNCATNNSSFEAQFDAFVTKLNADGSGLAYSTYLGGNLQDVGRDIAVDASGNAYVAGRAYSFDFPTTSGSMQSGNGGAARTTNGGAAWSATGSGLANSFGDSVTALAIDPTNPQIIYAGVYSSNGASGIFKSTNGGDSWTSINNGLMATNVRSLAIAPTSPPTLYAGMDVAGVYKSTDGGASWFAVRNGLDEDSIAALVVDPVNPNIIYAGGNDSGVSKTTNGGASWFYTGGPGSSSLSLVLHPLNPSTIYAGRVNSVDKSTDGGATWEYIGEGISNPITPPTVKALVIDPTAPNKIYAASTRGVFKTTNGGSTPWVASNNGLSSTTVSSMVMDWSNPSILYAGTPNGVYKSYDSGNNWQPVNKGMVGSLVACLVLHPANPQAVYAGRFGSVNLFISKVNGTGTGFGYSTYLAYGTVGGIAIDGAGNAYVTGSTVSGFPVTQDAIQSTSVSDEAFLAKISASGADLLFATYLGGNSGDSGNGVATDAAGNCYLAGQTFSSNFPTTAGAFQSGIPGLNYHGFVAKIALPVTANYDNYSTPTNSPLGVPAPGVLSNDASGGQGTLSALLVSGVRNGQLTLNANGSFSYTPNANFTGHDSFTYKARAANGMDSNLAEVVIQVQGSASPCTGSLTPASQSFPAAGGVGNIAIDVDAGCGWKAVSQVPSFITITSTPTGTGDGMLTYSVAVNSSASARTGIISVAGQSFTVFQGAAFQDVAENHPFYNEIGKLSARGITFGCGGGNYCPDATVTREQMAVFIVKSLGEFNPPTPASQRFNDVPPSSPFYNFVDRMGVLQITNGCSISPPLYCPSGSVSREQMAAFLIKALHEPGYVPPTPGSQRFNDVPPSSPFYAFIDEMAVRNITAGCSASPPLYCPVSSVTRAQMAAFLVKAFNL